MGNTSTSKKVLIKIYFSINKTWNWLIKPTADLTDPEAYRKSRLIISLILISIIVFLMYIISILVFDVYLLRLDFVGELVLYTITDSIALCFLFAAFFISKTKFYYVSAIIFLIVAIGILLINIFYEDQIIYQILFILMLFSFLILYSNLFLSTRGVATVSLISLPFYIIITTLIKPQDPNIILLMGFFFGFEFLLVIIQNHFYYKRVDELELAITEKNNANKRVEFLSSLLTHDIANKISRISGYMLLINQKTVDEEIKQYIENTITTCNEGASLITKINHLQKIEQSTNLLSQKVHLNAVLNQVIELYTDHAITNGIDIVFNKGENEDLYVLGGELLKELFSNLMDNAINHSKGSLIVISLSQSTHRIIVTFEDNGVGIPDAIVETLFHRGVKGDHSKGSGLGLYLVKTIVDNIKATINVDRSSLGGAKFIFEFSKERTSDEYIL